MNQEPAEDEQASETEEPVGGDHIGPQECRRDKQRRLAEGVVCVVTIIDAKTASVEQLN
jgi:hypothetical protein